MAKTENLTIMFTDIVGYTTLTSAMSREALRALLREHDRLLLGIARAFGGRLVKSIGDALLMTFRSPTDAVRCAMAMQNALAHSRRTQPRLSPLHIRVAINLGEVRCEYRDVFGEAVNLAARLQALTPADAIYFTESVYLSMNKAEVPSEALGSRKIRGVPETVRLYSVPAYRVHRLVAADEALGSAHEPPYPHVDVPVRRLDALRAAAAARLAPAWKAGIALIARTSEPIRWMVVTGVCIAVVLSLTLYVPARHLDASLSPAAADEGLPPEVDAGVLEGESLLARQDFSGLGALIDRRLKVNPRDAVALLLRAHLAFAKKRPLDGVADYSAALALQPGLQGNARMARNLVALLDQQPSASKSVALQHASEALLQRLAQRTAEPGYYGRAQAAGLLRELGHADRIDRFGYAVQELEGRTECKDRLAAVRELRALKDRRAVPYLEQTLAGGLSGWLRQRCLRSEAQATLDELKARAKS